VNEDRANMLDLPAGRQLYVVRERERERERGEKERRERERGERVCDRERKREKEREREREREGERDSDRVCVCAWRETLLGNNAHNQKTPRQPFSSAPGPLCRQSAHNKRVSRTLSPVFYNIDS